MGGAEPGQRRAGPRGAHERPHGGLRGVSARPPDRGRKRSRDERRDADSEHASPIRLPKPGFHPVSPARPRARIVTPLRLAGKWTDVEAGPNRAALPDDEPFEIQVAID